MLNRFIVLTLSAFVLTGSLIPVTPSNAANERRLFIPTVFNRINATPRFGLQAQYIGRVIQLPSLANQTGVRGVRYGILSWKAVQPEAGAGYNWSAVDEIEEGIRQMRQFGIKTMLIIGDSPNWATIPRYSDNRSTSCAAIRDEAIDEFAAFAAAVVRRYSQPEFDVTYYELGNEVDIDPHLVFINNGFGCWGDLRDPYYGGEHYGRMLKQVYPAIKAANPAAQVLFGGLLLDRPNTTDPTRGKPELFLEGALRAGAGPFFDILPFHAYPPYLDQAIFGQIDHDTDLGTNPWTPLGGNIRGKSAFLRSTMARYGVTKTLWLNETSLFCPNDDLDTVRQQYPWCYPPSIPFYEAQANYLVRTLVRAVSDGIEHVTWYALENDWRETGLIDNNFAPKLSFLAYQHLTQKVGELPYRGPTTYGNGTEGYRFGTNSSEVHIVWTTKGVGTITLSVPTDRFVAASSRDGVSLPITTVGGQVQVQVGFSPVYLELR